VTTRGCTNGPIFVVGAPRSGTTLLRYMLCSHPRFYVPPESNFIPRFFRRQPNKPLTREQALTILNQIGAYRHFWRDWREAPLDGYDVVSKLSNITPASLISAVYERYAEQYGAARWGDKSPLYVAYVDLIAEMFPTSQIVHIIRDARDVVASSLNAYRGRRYFYMDAYYAGRTWRERVLRGTTVGRQLPSHRYHEIRYEDLTADPEHVLRELCHFLREDFLPAMTTPEVEARRHYHSRGIHKRVRTPVTSSSSGRWREKLAARDQRLVQQITADLLLKLDYPVLDLGHANGPERVRGTTLRVKYLLLATSGRLLQGAGLFHPTFLLDRGLHRSLAAAARSRVDPVRKPTNEPHPITPRAENPTTSPSADVSRRQWASLRAISLQTYASWFQDNRRELEHRSPFHDPAWLDAVARGTGFDLGFVGAYDGIELTAVVPGFLVRRGPFRLFGSPLRGTMTSYLGPLSIDPGFTADSQREMVISCAEFVRREWRASYARFTLRDADSMRRLPGPDWHDQRGGSYRLDLSPGEETLFANLKSHCRRNVRKAAREGVVIHPLDDAKLFYRILKETFRRHGSSSWHSSRFFAIVMRELPPRDLLWAWGAHFDGQVIAVGLFFHDDREMHFISGASLPQFGSLPTSYLLHWHAIATATRAGLRVFNSEASKIPSIDHFKETFNPVRQSRGTLIWAPSSVWVAQRTFKRWHYRARRVRGRLPV
jgi:hypothetical protein